MNYFTLTIWYEITHVITHCVQMTQMIITC